MLEGVQVDFAIIQSQIWQGVIAKGHQFDFNPLIQGQTGHFFKSFVVLTNDADFMEFVEVEPQPLKVTAKAAKVNNFFIFLCLAGSFCQQISYFLN